MHNDHQTTLNEPDAKPVLNASDPQPGSGSYVDQPLNPLWLILITIVAGLPASAPIAGAIAVRCGYRKLGWVCGILLTVCGTLALILAVLWGVEWYWTTLSLVAFHIVCGSGLCLLLRKPNSYSCLAAFLPVWQWLLSFHSRLFQQKVLRMVFSCQFFQE